MFVLGVRADNSIYLQASPKALRLLAEGKTDRECS